MNQPITSIPCPERNVCNTNSRIVFFDIDGTLTSEKDGKVPASAVKAIQAARTRGHKMFLCSGRTRISIEDRFLAVGFDGVIAGCGTHIFLENGETITHHTLSPESTHLLLSSARKNDIDILFEAASFVAFDSTRPLKHPISFDHLKTFSLRGLDVFPNVDAQNFATDKLCIFSDDHAAVSRFLSVSDPLLDCIVRGNGMYELVPRGYSKATGIQNVLDYYGMTIDQAYVFGDSNNDLSMLRYVPHSIVMGNAYPPELKKEAWYVTKKASEDGILLALNDLGFLKA